MARPAGEVSPRGKRKIVGSLASEGSIAPPIPKTSMCAPAGASFGALAHSRNTSPSIGRSGVKCTEIEPSTVPAATSTLTLAVYTGRCGSGGVSATGAAHGSTGGAVVDVVEVVVE